jgi:amylosucrase/maltose alpha-D-glucosyltransferase/alpha-amylase
MCASLCGLEAALEAGDEELTELAIRRILMIHGIIMTIGGIPLIYLGDELGTLNDYTYQTNPGQMGDSRWVHRPVFDWARAAERHDRETVTGRVYDGFLRLSQLRQQNMAFTRGETEIIDTGNNQVFAYFRTNDNYSAAVLANFSEHEQSVDGRRLRQLGLRRSMIDLVSGRTIIAGLELRLDPYQFTVLSRYL